VSPLGSPGSNGFSPSQIIQAYGYNQLSFNGTPADGRGTTIAIVDAFNDPTVQSDLQAFDKHYGLPNPVLDVVNQTGGTTLPAPNAGWAGEIALDVEWAHAIAPAANLLLVEATNQALANMMLAVQYAESQPGVVVVSMSFGYPEKSIETTYDNSTFSPANNPNVAFVAASGDHGAPVLYPSVSPDVLAVGGTSLYLNSSGNYASESAWTGSGGGLSQYESQPSFQNGVVTQSTKFRTTPDVSYDANPSTGLEVYQTFGNSAPTKPWVQVGGTSDASPQWAALIAIADEGRALAGESPLNNTELLPWLYQLPSMDFHDVTTGQSTGFPHYKAGPGYDLATGLGSPVVPNLVPDLISGPAATQFTFTVSPTVDLGSNFTITVQALNANGRPAPGYTGTIDLTSSDGSVNLSYTFTQSDAGSHTFTISLNTLGAQSITATDAAASSLTGTANVFVLSGDGFSVTGFPSSVTAGSTQNFTVTAVAPDGSALSNYNGTVVISSTDTALQPFDVTLTGGTGTFSATLTTAGQQSLIATDSVDATMVGSETGITVLPDTPTHMKFLSLPSGAIAGDPIDPAVSVELLDQYGNVATNDNTDQVALTLGSNSTGATLTGGSAVTVSGGIAAFPNLSVDQAGTYTLVASSSGLNNFISRSFTVQPNPVLENFGNGLGAYSVYGSATPNVSTTASAAHPGTGTLGLDDGGDGNWYYRTDAAGQVNPGDSLSVWVQLAGAANGRAYFGFGSNASGTLSVVLAANTGQFLIQSNPNYYTYTTLASNNLTYKFNTWYRLEVDWGTSGAVAVTLYASNGTTVVDQLSASTNDLSPGDFGFRAFGSPKYFDTVTVTRGVNNFAVPAAVELALPASLGSSSGSSNGNERPRLTPVGTGTVLPVHHHTATTGNQSVSTPLWYPAVEHPGEEFFPVL
jgi:hypothetical protein